MLDLTNIKQVSVGSSESGFIFLIISLLVVGGFYLYSKFLNENEIESDNEQII